MKNHYQTLGIKRDASIEDIKKAYRKLAQKFHPDKNEGDEFFEERFKEIQEAYEILSDSSRKINYDNEYDTFFIIKHNKDSAHTNKEEYNHDTEEEQERIKKSNADRKRKRESEDFFSCLVLFIIGLLLALLISW